LAISVSVGYVLLVTNESINTSVPPSGTGCVECLATDGWWLHLRRCAECGHVGCCDNSPSQHATAHFRAAGHRVIQSFEPGENWFFDYDSQQFAAGPELAPPHSHPARQPVPGPAGAVPPDWQSRLHD
jgi:Zn-finger in ubiquitin-hydrolases and other protein